MNRVKKYREALGLSQSELARRSGLPRNTVYSLEKKGSKLQATTARLLSQALDVPEKVLIGAANDEYCWQDAKVPPDNEGNYLVAYYAKHRAKPYYLYNVCSWVNGGWWLLTEDGELLTPLKGVRLWSQIPEPQS